MIGINKRDVYSKPEVVVKAIHRLGKNRGISAQDIIRYIVNNYGIPESKVKRQALSALRKGINYGLINEENGYYKLLIDEPRYEPLPKKSLARNMKKNKKKIKKATRARK